MFFGANPVDLYMRKGNDDEQACLRQSPGGGQAVQQRGLRILPQEATSKEMADSKLRRPTAYNRTVQRPEIVAGGPIVFYKQIGRESSSQTARPRGVPG